MRIVKLILFVFGTAMLLAYCSSRIYIPSAQQITTSQKYFPEADSTFLSQGHSMYENKCSSCHFLYRPGKYTAKEWEHILPEMKEKAKLTDEEFRQIKIYLYSLSSEE